MWLRTSFKGIAWKLYRSKGEILMLIQCTKKLLDELNIKPETQAIEEPLFSWHANLITVNRRKTVVLMNDKNRYVIVLHGLKAKDFKELDKYIIQAITETFMEECIKEEIINKLINSSNNIIYTKTKDRSKVAQMNKSCETVYFFEDLLDKNNIIQTRISKRVSRSLVGDRLKEYIQPNEELYSDFRNFANRSIFSCRAAELEITLELENHNIWRKIILPINTPFEEFHKILQLVFGWKDYHLHEFYIYDMEKFDKDKSVNYSGYHKSGYKAILNLVCDEEAFYYPDDIPMVLETGIRISDYLPTDIKYNYDFGDNWQHYIEVVRIIDDYDKNYPVCIDWEGNPPPEDAGGEGGFHEFLEIIRDENHPEHDGTVNWSRFQGYEDFNIELVNRRLKYI